MSVERPEGAGANNPQNQPDKQEIQKTVNPIELKDKIIEALKTVYDPEIPVDIYELGLVYDIQVKPDGSVYILMTMTTPFCPVADILPQQVKERVGAIEGVKDVEVEITFDPPWTPDRMSEKAKAELGMF